MTTEEIDRILEEMEQIPSFLFPSESESSLDRKRPIREEEANFFDYAEKLRTA